MSKIKLALDVVEDLKSLADKSRDGHREAVKAIITKYGANNLSSP